jgi:hypothetical protein
MGAPFVTTVRSPGTPITLSCVNLDVSMQQAPQW